MQKINELNVNAEQKVNILLKKVENLKHLANKPNDDVKKGVDLAVAMIQADIQTAYILGTIYEYKPELFIGLATVAIKSKRPDIKNDTFVDMMKGVQSIVDPFTKAL